MSQQTRRSMLKKGGIVMSGLLFSRNVAASKASRPSLTIRHDIDQDSISPSYIEERKQELISSSTGIRDESSFGHRSPIELSENEKITAYNLDVFDGAPTEFISSYEDQDEAVSAQNNRQVESFAEIVEKQHDKADRIMEQRRSNNATSTTSPLASWDFGDWTKMARNRWHKTDKYGNEMGWTVAWRRNPSNSSKQALKTEIRMYPKNNSGTYEADSAKSAIRFNKSRVTVRDHKPGNTIGSSTSSFNLGFGGGNVTVGYTSGTTNSNLEINDWSNIDSQMNVIHQYELNTSSGLVHNSLFLNAAATADVNGASGATFANIDLNSTFGTLTPSQRDVTNLGNSYRYSWG